jgi:hypothetical protein
VGGTSSTAYEKRGIAQGRSARAQAHDSIAHGGFSNSRAARSHTIGSDTDALAPLSQVFGAGTVIAQERAYIAARELEIARNTYGDFEDYPFNQWGSDYSSSIILYSPNGDGWKISVDDAGVLSAAAMPVEQADSFWPSFAPTVDEDYCWIETNSDGSILVAARAGAPEYLSMSTDGGATWNDITAAGSREWRRVLISDDGVTMFAGATTGTSGSYGFTFWESTDSGASWTSHAAPFSGSATTYPAWTFDGSADLSIITASFLGLLFTTDDLGATWTAAPDDTFPNGGYVGITVSADGTVHYAILSGSGYFIASQDSGATWTASPTPLGELRPGMRYSGFFGAYNPIATTADGSFVVVGMDGGPLIYSEDFGETWTEIEDSGYHEWQSVAISDDGTWIIAGSNDRSGVYVGDRYGLGYVNFTAQNPSWMTTISRDGVMMYGIPIGGSSPDICVISFDTTTL